MEWRRFAHLRDFVLSRISGQHYPVADHSLHVTLADLVAGDGYRQALGNHTDLERRIAERVVSILRTLDPVSRSLRWRVAGIIFLRHAVACLVEPCSVLDYDPICRIEIQFTKISFCPNWESFDRDRFLHVTLAYFDILPSVDERLTWLKYFDEIQTEGHSLCSDLDITGATLCTFESMASFEPLSLAMSFSSGEP